jgi:Tol biopolymer transport system component
VNRLARLASIRSTLRFRGVLLVTLAASFAFAAGLKGLDRDLAEIPDVRQLNKRALGQIAFVSSRDGNPEIYTINADGTNLTRLTNDPAVDEEPAWSPDGKRIAFVSNRSGSSELYVMHGDGSDVVRRTFSGGFTENPSWSPDGTKIVYSTLSNGSANLWVVSPNAGGPGPTLLFEAPGWEAQPSWSPDGTRLALVSDRYAYDFVWDIFRINADGSGFTGLTGGDFDNLDYLGPSWSPNGATIAHVGVTRLGIDQYSTTLAVMNADGTGRRPLIPACSECGAVISWGRLANCSWSPDGRVIVFTSGTTNALNVSWVKADGSASGLIVSNGWNPSWRPSVSAP